MIVTKGLGSSLIVTQGYGGVSIIKKVIKYLSRRDRYTLLRK